MNIDYQRIKQELDELAKRHGGSFTPEHLVEFARNPMTAAHARFNWNDTKAAHEWRLQQARDLIRVFVVMVECKRPTQLVHVEVKQWVSLSKSRGEGFRPIGEVLEKKDTRLQLLLDTLDRLESIKEVALFSELDGVAIAIAAVRKQFPKDEPFSAAE